MNAEKAAQKRNKPKKTEAKNSSSNAKPRLVKPALLKNEAAIRDWIAANPDVLPLSGGLICRDKERVQPNGRLDLLLENKQGTTRYVVEIQLGALNESHIVRAIEYWDWERTRYPYYDHQVVLLGEKPGRFFNVVCWANRRMPLMFIQMLGVDKTGIIFNKVLDIIEPAEDDSSSVPDADKKGRKEWEREVGRESMGAVDKIFDKVVRLVAPRFELAYRKFNIGLRLPSGANNLLNFYPTKSTALSIIARVDESEEWTRRLEDICDRYNTAAGQRGYFLRIPRGREGQHLGVIKEIFLCALKEAGLEGEMRSEETPESNDSE